MTNETAGAEPMETPRLDADACKKICVADLAARAAGAGDEFDRQPAARMLHACSRRPAVEIADGAEDGPAVWIWSDLHLGHANILRYAKRPFRNKEEMDDALFENWRRSVGRGDRMIVVGDAAMAWAVTAERERRIREAPGAEKLLIVGNHDMDSSGLVPVQAFDGVHPAAFAPGDPPLVITHLPLRRVPGGAINVHGHIHEKPAPSGRHINVCIEQLAYKPVELRRIRALAAELAAGRRPPGAATIDQLRLLDSIRTVVG